MLKYILKIGDRYYYRRRVPSYVKYLDPRKEIRIALKTGDLKEALSKAHIHNEHIESFWKSLIKAGNSNNASAKYKSTVKLARAYGFAYKTTFEIADASVEEIINRLAAAPTNTELTGAILGGVDSPRLSLSECEIQYWDLTIDRTTNKSDHKISKWKNPRKAAFTNFIKVVGDKDVSTISRADILAFKDWWRTRIAQGLSPATANKQLQQVRDILETTTIHNEINLEFGSLFANTRFKYEIQSRPPFEAGYVQDKLLSGLSELNNRDRMVLFAMADTGARESEIFGLTPDDIRLDDEIPFIWIRPRENYRLKTATSERQIPLVGTALRAFKTYPQGFQHEGNPDVFSNIVNKYLTEKKLRPTPQHSAYSLRHTFKDRLRDAEAPEEIIDGLMGHKKSGPKYGRGHKLETKYKWLDKIAYRVPSVS